MQSDDDQTVLLIPALPANLGLSVNKDYDPVARLSRNVAKDPLRVGEVYLHATVAEMIQIRRLCKSLEEDYRALIRDTKHKYDE